MNCSANRRSLSRVWARTFRQQELLAGAAILGDGRVGLILDVDTLVKCRPLPKLTNLETER